MCACGAASSSPEARSSATSGADADEVVVFAQRSWYRERPEAERRWTGRLEERPREGGPAARLGLGFEIDTVDGPLPVYAAGAEHLLRPLAGRRVLLVGKRVDLTNEGFGVEIWPASVREVAEAGS